MNGKPIDPITLKVKDVWVKDGTATGTADVSAKALARYFARGINRFEVAGAEVGHRHAADVVMDVQM